MSIILLLGSIEYSQDNFLVGKDGENYEDQQEAAGEPKAYKSSEISILQLIILIVNHWAKANFDHSFEK